MNNDYITSLAQVSCEEQFTEDLSREYEQWLDEREQEQCWSAGGSLAGHVSEHVNKALADFGFHPDWIEDPVWSLSGLSPLPAELRRILRIP